MPKPFLVRMFMIAGVLMVVGGLISIVSAIVLKSLLAAVAAALVTAGGIALVIVSLADARRAEARR